MDRGPPDPVLIMGRLLAFVALLLAAEALAEPLPLESLAGQPVALALREGEEALIVHFWATWCPECLKEFPVLEAAVPRCEAAGVRLVAVNVGEDRDLVVRYLATHEIGLPVLRDPRGQVWRGLRAPGLPTNLFWARTGRSIGVGPRDAEAWEKTLASLGCSPG